MGTMVCDTPPLVGRRFWQPQLYYADDDGTRLGRDCPWARWSRFWDDSGPLWRDRFAIEGRI